MGEIYLSSNYLIYVLILSFDIYQDNEKLLTNFRRNSVLMKNVITKWISANVVLLLISSTTSSFQKIKPGNEQCTFTAPFVSAQLKLTYVPQSITVEIYNEANEIKENGSVLKGFGDLLYKPFQNIISDNGNGSCKGATCLHFIPFKVCQDILAVAIEQQILVKFISVYIRKGNVQLISMVNIGKEKSAGRKKMTSTQKEKRSS